MFATRVRIGLSIIILFTGLSDGRRVMGKNQTSDRQKKEKRLNCLFGVRGGSKKNGCSKHFEIEAIDRRKKEKDDG